MTAARILSTPRGLSVEKRNVIGMAVFIQEKHIHLQHAGEISPEPGTMLPKIEAAISYLGANPQGEVLITSMDALKDALKGKNSTKITTYA